MPNLSQHLTLDKKAINSPNLCDRFDREDLNRIGCWVHDNYIRDKGTRVAWERRIESALDLAMQVQKAKSFPWPGCSNIAFPLVTIAAMQFHARAYPAIVNGRDVVACRTVGPDPEGIGADRADRISKHMSWQLLEQDEGWEEAQDRAILNVSIVGCGFKKTYYDPGLGHPVSEFVQAKDLVFDYWAKSVEKCAVKSHVIPMYRNDLRERVLRGTYFDCLGEAWYEGAAQVPTTRQDTGSNNRAGLSQPDSDEETPFTLLEQHCSLDLDGDGYAEPYIITIEETSQQVLRIVTRFNREEDIERTNRGEIIRINAAEFFTKIPFIPSPDGGVLDIGFGALIGPLNESVNSSINQLFDAGTLSNTAGGFLGRGAKIRGGVFQFQPFSWNRVDSSGDDLRKSIFPLPVREPSTVMFNLLSLLIDYTNRIAGATDMLVGENPGQNTPAETARTMTEQGQKIYSAIFKRIWRSMKQEFKKVYNLNALYLPDRSSFGEGGEIRREDYSAVAASVVPVADPTIASDGASFAKARMLAERASATPGYDADEVEKLLLKTLGYDNLDVLYPGQKNMPPPAPDVKVQIQGMRNEIELAKLEQAKMEFIMTMQETSRMNSAKVAELEAKALVLAQEAESLPAKRNVEAFRAGIEALREQNQSVNAQLDRMMESFKNEQQAGTSGKSGTGRAPGAISGLEAAPSNNPLDAMSN